MINLRKYMTFRHKIYLKVLKKKSIEELDGFFYNLKINI